MIDLIDPLIAKEIFFDGVHEIRIIEGVVRIALYTMQDHAKVVVVRLAVPVTELPDVIQSLVMSMARSAGVMVDPANDDTAH